MSDRPRGGSADAYGVDEVAVTMSIREGKFTAESKSGPKSGSVELVVDGSGAHLGLNGAGSDRASAELTGPELANFRTMIDAALSTLAVGETPPSMGRNVLASGFRPLVQAGDAFAVEFEASTLRRLDLLDEDGGIAGGGRQVQCTVLGNGTAILNLTGNSDAEHPV